MAQDLEKAPIAIDRNFFRFIESKLTETGFKIVLAYDLNHEEGYVKICDDEYPNFFIDYSFLDFEPQDLTQENFKLAVESFKEDGRDQEEPNLFKILDEVTTEYDSKKYNAFSIEYFTTEELFDMLPPFVNVKGDLYHFSMLKGRNGIIIEYKMNLSEGGVALGNTYRRGNNLREVTLSMLNWLHEFNYLGERWYAKYFKKKPNGK